MDHVCECKYECSLNARQIREFQSAFVKLAVEYPLFYYIIDQIFYVGRRRFLQRTRGRFNSIGKADDCRLPVGRFRACIPEISLVDFSAIRCLGFLVFNSELKLFFCLVVEEGKNAGSMMFPDCFAHNYGYLVQHRQAQTLLYVRGYNKCAHAGGEIVMGIVV